MAHRKKDTKTPRVFLSSTSEDLKLYREAARDAAEAAGFLNDRMESFAASGNPPLEKCREEVSACDLVVAIVAHRYGWVPPEQPAGESKSITWLECVHAENDAPKKEVLAFVLDPKHQWQEELKEDFRLTSAMRDRTATAELFQEVNRNVDNLVRFKAWLDEGRTRQTFTTPEDLKFKVYQALTEWRLKHPQFALPPSAHAAIQDATRYLQRLREQTSHMDIRGLAVGQGRAHRFGIEELYIPLTAAAPLIVRQKGGKTLEPELAQRRSVELQELLPEYPRLVIVGDPGAGKTTFLRRISYALSQKLLGEAPEAAKSRLGIDDQPFPIFVRVGEMVQHMERCEAETGRPTLDHSPRWLPHFLGAQASDAGCGLDEEFFRVKLESGKAIVLLDGLDEAPSRVRREAIARLFQEAVTAYSDCRFVVTTRPQSYQGDAILDRFTQVQVEPLDKEAIEGFLHRWCEALFTGVDDPAAAHQQELLEALQARPEIRRMARNPVMLTALAVVHWNENRLPEQRALLYESIITWLLRAREQRAGRSSTDLCNRRLRRLALAMQTHAGGRRTQVSRRWAAEAIADEFGAAQDERSIATAEDFLAEEEVDSGVISSAGSEVRFWHLTFQEYLAARAIGAKASLEQQLATLFEENRLYQPEWRETALLFAGVLYEQGFEKMDAFVSAVLKKLGNRPPLKRQAQTAGLLGSMVRDLTPYRYEPKDPQYRKTLDAAMGVFGADASRSLDLKVRIEAADALGLAGDPRFADPTGNWVRIPAGEFWMGAQANDPAKPYYDSEAYEDESPPHPVELSAYEIGRYPVTVAEFQRFVDDEGYLRKELWVHGGFGEREQPGDWDQQLAHPTRPMVSVNWFEAAAYCAWAGGRLPTEAEWERAARGLAGGKYPWGVEEPDAVRANYNLSAGSATPVGLYPLGATEDGLLDLAGNGVEWCSDWFGDRYYAASSKRDPKGPAEGDGRVLRGGSWFYLATNLRCAVRNAYQPDIRGVNIGFRCVREVFP